MAYLDGCLAAVPTANRDLYLEHAREMAALFKEQGALQVTECWGVDVPQGEITSMLKAVQCKPDETVVFSWILWPSREVAQAGMEALMQDQRMQASEMPLDGKRMIFGGFDVVMQS